MTYIRVDLNAVETEKLRLIQNVQTCSQLNGKASSTLNGVNSVIAARRSLYYRMNQTAQRIAEVDRRMRILSGFIQASLAQYSGTERDLSQQAQTLLSPTPLLPHGQSLSLNETEKLNLQMKQLAFVAQTVVDWLSRWMDTFTTSRSMPDHAAVAPYDGPQLIPYDPSKMISEKDILNRDDPEAYKRLMEGPFGRMSEEERRTLIRVVENGNKEYERSMEKYEYGHSFADGFGHGIEKSIQGLVDIISHPIQTGKVMYEGVRDSAIRVVHDPIGVVKDIYNSAEETVVDFIESGQGKKGDYIGSLFTGLVLTRGLSKTPSLFKSRKPDSPNQAGHGHHNETNNENIVVSSSGKSDAASTLVSGKGVYKQYSGGLKQSAKEDAGADLLAEKLGGQPRMIFNNDPKGREFDVVSDQYIGQTKTSMNNLSSQFREQAKATIEAAIETGRQAYFHFEKAPADKVIRQLREYETRYDVEIIIDISTF